MEKESRDTASSDRNDLYSPSLGSRGSIADSTKITTEGYDIVVEFNCVKMLHLFML